MRLSSKKGPDKERADQTAGSRGRPRYSGPRTTDEALRRRLGAYRDETIERRAQCGAWLREKRESAGLSQSDFAKLSGMAHKHAVSQLECGYMRVRPEKYLSLAAALRMNPQEFVKEMMRYYDPVAFEILFTAPDSGS
jgi:DNA-binding XRE family transcriptional regulator